MGALGFALVFPAIASAQVIKPWVPPAADSLVRVMAEARARFQTNQGDSVTGSNLEAYEMVGRMGRRLLRSLGRQGLIQAHAVEPMLDSLGMDTDVEVDPDMPHFVLLMVRNPHRRTAAAVGYLYWYKENDLRMQGAIFPGGRAPAMRVWWTGWQQAPYSWGVADRSLGEAHLRFTLFRLAPHGNYWTLLQHEDSGIRLGSKGTVSWVDVDGDQRMELIAWVPADRDSIFEACEDCPGLVSELVFVERLDGFRLLDTRLLPTPFATFTQFVRLLLDGQRTQAARLLKDPTKLQSAIAAGWASSRGRRTWVVESAEPGVAWPQWLMLRFQGPQGPRRYRMDFEVQRGRWLIRDWTAREAPPARSSGGGARRSETPSGPGGRAR
jgi:hypothetical protein